MENVLWLFLILQILHPSIFTAPNVEHVLHPNWFQCSSMEQRYIANCAGLPFQIKPQTIIFQIQNKEPKSPRLR